MESQFVLFVHFWPLNALLLPRLRVKEPRETLSGPAPLFGRELGPDLLRERRIGLVRVPEGSFEAALR